MKYNITLNQPMMIEHKLNVTQWCVIDVISVASVWCSAVIVENEVYYWVARQKIAEELSSLDLKPDTVYRVLKGLVELGFINHIKQGKKDLVSLTDKSKKMFSTMSDLNPSYYVGKKSEFTMSEKNPTYNNTTYNNTNNKEENSNKEQVTKKKAINKKDIYKDFIEQLKKACKTKSKVKVTKEGLELFQGIENKAQLFKDYLAHQEEKAGFASRITVYMEDYETVHAVKQKEEGEVKW